MEKPDPEIIISKVVDLCSDCDSCRPLMDISCLFFPELYRLYDKEKATGIKIDNDELKNLVNLCNYCALCPCPNVRRDIIEAKTRFMERDGLKFTIRIMEDVENIAGKLGTFPRFSNIMFQNRMTGSIIKKCAGIHKKREFPKFPEKKFNNWVKENKLNIKPGKKSGRKVAYFAGCTGRFFFPEVAIKVVELLQKNGISVYIPEQKCCGMPSMLEGDRKLTMNFAGFNIDELDAISKEGYDIICSCPTCGYMLKTILREGAYYSNDYQTAVSDDKLFMKVPDNKSSNLNEDKKFNLLRKSIFENILKDDGYFSSISPLKRIRVAENTYDLGEYLKHLHGNGEFEISSGSLTGRFVYYPPCHLREQQIGAPYMDLLKLIPGMDVEMIEGPFYCCGISGIMGYKKDFYDSSVELGSRLMNKIKELKPDIVVTDCLSCRIQIKQLLPCKVKHPVEILNDT